MKTLITDNGRNYIGTNFKRLLHKNNIKHIKTTPYNPQANGMVEKANHTIVTKLKMLALENPRHKWTTPLKTAVEQYTQNSTHIYRI